jgi:hypothetical protein
LGTRMFGWRKGSLGGGGLGRKVRHETGHEWNGWIMEGVSARVGLLGWGRGLGTGDGGLGTGAHRGGGGLPFRPCFGPHSASPTTSPGLRRPAPAPPGPATPLRRPRASLTEAAQVLLSFETAWECPGAAACREAPPQAHLSSNSNSNSGGNGNQQQQEQRQ